MKIAYRTLMLICLASCNQRDTKTSTIPFDSTTVAPNKDTTIKPIEKQTPLTSKDSSMILFAEKVLVTLKEKNFKQLATYAHPDSGIFFSAYAYVNKEENTKLSVTELKKPATPSRKVMWGAFEESDSSALMTISTYFDKYVYDVDFLNAPVKSVNKYHTQGTDINNIEEAFPNTTIVEFFFPGFEPKYEGLDYRGLRLVFKPVADKYYLMGVVHDHWTP